MSFSVYKVSLIFRWFASSSRRRISSLSLPRFMPHLRETLLFSLSSTRRQNIPLNHSSSFFMCWPCNFSWDFLHFAQSRTRSHDSSLHTYVNNSFLCPFLWHRFSGLPRRRPEGLLLLLLKESEFGGEPPPLFEDKLLDKVDKDPEMMLIGKDGQESLFSERGDGK